MRFGLRALLALCVMAVVTGVAGAAELVMFRSAGCPWCARWDQEVGAIYPKTEVGGNLPLRMVDLDSDRTGGLRVRSPIRYTPTFVLAENGEEVGRIEGYPGDAFFWGLLERMVAQLPAPPPKGATAPRSGGAMSKERIL